METKESTTRPELTRTEVERGLLVSNVEAGVSTIASTFVSGAFLAGFAKELGANDFWMGAVAAVPALAGLSQLNASYYVEKRGERRSLVALMVLISRLFWLPVAGIVFFCPQVLRLPVFFFLLTGACVAMHTAMPAFNSWISDLVPENRRGRYFGGRNAIIGLIGIVAAQLGGIFVDHVGTRTGFTALFVLSAATGLASYVLFRKTPEPTMKVADHRPPILEFVRIPFRDANYRKLIVYFIIWNAGVGLVGNFYFVYMNMVLHYSYSTVTFLGTLTGVAMLATLGQWGRLADRYGNKAVLIINAYLVFLLPVVWVFASPVRPTATFIMLAINQTCGGIIWGGVIITQFNLLIGLSPVRNRSIYMASANAISGVAAGVSPLVGGVLMQELSGFRFRGFGLDVTQYQILFLIAASFRLACALLVRGIPEPNAALAGEMIRAIGKLATAGAAKQLRKLTRPKANRKRE